MRVVEMMLLSAVCCAQATLVLAQSPAQREARSFAITQTPGIGLSWRLTQTKDLGLLLSANRDDSPEGEVNEFTLGVSLRHYWRPASAISPYTHIAVLGLGGREVREAEPEHPGWTRHGIGADIAFGLEWFPLKSVSAGAHAGIGFMSRWQDRKFGDTGAKLQESDTHFGTAHSGLEIRLHF